jgi:hypothetical protein
MDGLLKADPSVFYDRAKLQLLQSCQAWSQVLARLLDSLARHTTPPCMGTLTACLALWLGDDIPELADTADPSGRHVYRTRQAQDFPP